MEKEGGSLVDRPRSIAAGEMLSNGMGLTMARSGERFRRLRKAIHPHLQPKAAEAYQVMQRDNAMNFILDVLDDPTNHQKHAERYVITMAFVILSRIQRYPEVCSISRASGDLWDIRAHYQRRSRTCSCPQSR
jgi:cytochrome P450